MTIQMLNVLLTKDVLADKWQNAVEDAIRIISSQPDIVRCMNCRYATRHCSDSVFGKPLYDCSHVRQIGRETQVHPGDWYCADGERRTDDA